MKESYGEGNLIAQTEAFLDKALSNWTDSIKALETCEEVLVLAQELHIVSRCIDSLAMKACADTKLFNWPVAGCNSVHKPARPRSVDDWWFEDVSFLSFPLFKQLIQTVESRGMKPESIAASIAYYTKRHIPVMDRQSSFNDTNSALSNAHQRTLLEEIVELLPNEKGATSAKFLLRLLRMGMILQVNHSCRENLERRVGIHLDQAALEDLLIPNMSYSMETLYDIDCVQRVVDHFALTCQAPSAPYSPTVVEFVPVKSGSDTMIPMTLVADLVDEYLAEVAPDVNLKLPKFHALAAAIPDCARPLNDGLYHAIDVYLKAHPWLTDSERGQLCGLMNWQKLSLDASTHAAQNERLPLRVMVQVLFFEQLRLRTSISGWFFVSDNPENPQNPSSNLGLPKNNGSCKLDPAQEQDVGASEVKERVSELEKECLIIKQELEKLSKRKKSWKIIPLKFFARSKPHPVKEASALNEEQNNKNDCMPQ